MAPPCRRTDRQDVVPTTDECLHYLYGGNKRRSRISVACNAVPPRVVCPDCRIHAYPVDAHRS